MRSGLCVLAVMLMAPPIGQDSKNQESKAPERNELSSLETLWNEAHRTGDADKLDACGRKTSSLPSPRCRS